MKFFDLKILSVVLFFLASKTCEQGTVPSNVTASKVEVTVENAVPDEMYPSDKLIIATHTDFAKKHYPEKILEFKKNPLSKNDVVFLGNSITEQAGDWAIKLKNPKVKNRGISGDTTDGVLARLGEITYCEPKQVFLLIGINDLFRDDMTPVKVCDNILKIVNQINQASPKTKIYVHTILPTSTEKIKEKIKATNAMLLKSHDKKRYELISLYQDFANEQDLMNMELSIDGVHLNEKGYNVWIKKIINLI